MTGEAERIRLVNGDCLEILRAMPENSIDSAVIDPPYGLGKVPDPRVLLRQWLDGEEYETKGGGFMGQKWDAFVPGPRLWSELARVLKPGAHAVIFAGQRTADVMGIALRLGGFEIRDLGGWQYWSGFPKSLDVSKAIDKQRDDRAQVLQVTRWIAEARDASGVTNKEIDAAFGFVGMAGHWTSQKSQPSVPTLDQVPILLGVLRCEPPPEIARLIWELNGKKGQPGAAWFDRVVVGKKTSGIAVRGEGMRHTIGGSRSVEVDITEPASDEAWKWNGWGTALKPCLEPWILARVPFSGTVADNVK